MSESLLKVLEQFFDELPATVRDDLSFMMVVLADESLVVQDVQDVYDIPAQRLFTAQTPIGRLGNLITAVSVFDVYFAMDAQRRFAPKPNGRRPAPAARAETGGIASLLDAYADQIDAIGAARQRWAELRDRKSTRLNSSHVITSRMPSSA